ncbi:hypothetical protein ACVWZD_000438 [Streptomyces sp. TE3672]
MISQILAVGLVCALTCVAVAVVTVVHGRRQMRHMSLAQVELQEQLALSEQACSDRDQAVEAFARDGAGPAAAAAGGSPSFAEFGIEGRLRDTRFALALQEAGDAVAAGLVKMKEQGAAEARYEAQREAQEATAATVRAVAESLQSPCQALIKKIDEGLARHKDDQAFATLSGIDHEAQLMSRVASSFSVLGGGSPGRRWKPSSLTAVVRGAMGSIRHHERVQFQELGHRAVKERAMQPVVYALASLLDNATKFSSPNAPVDVSFDESFSGVTVIVCDAGVRMNREQQVEARRALSGEPVNLHELGPRPRIGLWTVGTLGHRYGFTAHIDGSSPWGGTRAMLFLPDDILTTVEPPAPAAAPRAGTVTAAPDPEPGQFSIETAPSGLPQRRRKASVSPVADDAGGTAPQLSRRPGTASVAIAWSKGTHRASEIPVSPSSDDSAFDSRSE